MRQATQKVAIQPKMKSVRMSPPHTPPPNNNEQEGEETYSESTLYVVAQDPSLRRGPRILRRQSRRKPSMVPQPEEGITTHVQQTDVPQSEDGTNQATHDAQYSRGKFPLPHIPQIHLSRRDLQGGVCKGYRRYLLLTVVFRRQKGLRGTFMMILGLTNQRQIKNHNYWQCLTARVDDQDTQFVQPNYGKGILCIITSYRSPFYAQTSRPSKILKVATA